MKVHEFILDTKIMFTRIFTNTFFTHLNEPEFSVETLRIVSLTKTNNSSQVSFA